GDPGGRGDGDLAVLAPRLEEEQEHALADQAPDVEALVVEGEARECRERAPLAARGRLGRGGLHGVLARRGRGGRPRALFPGAAGGERSAQGEREGEGDATHRAQDTGGSRLRPF